jgi:pimeloyl-ACP methyl ester carboxylesterase
LTITDEGGYAFHAANPESMTAELKGVRRAAILLPIVLDLPVGRGLVSAVTREPELETNTIAGIPVGIARPGTGGPWPTYLFLTGAHPLRRKEPVVDRLMRGLARAGYLTVTPDLPGLGRGELSVETLEAAVEVATTLTEDRTVRNGRIALIGASTGASVGLLVAAHPKLSKRVSVVVAVTPFSDVRKVLCLATTGGYEEADGLIKTYPVAPLLRRAAFRSLLATLPAGEERRRLLALLPENDDRDVRECIRGQASPDEKTAAVLECLSNPQAERFPSLFDQLPTDVKERLNRLSPLLHAAHIGAPVELVLPPVDEYFPVAEAVSLAEAIPDARLTMTATLDHTRPGALTGRLTDLIRFGRFVVRGLAAAS